MGYKKSVHKSLMMISQVSIAMLVPIFLCSFVGLFLEKQYSVPAFIPLFFLGAFAGMRNVYIMLSSIYKEEEREKKNRKDE